MFMRIVIVVMVVLGLFVVTDVVAKKKPKKKDEAKALSGISIVGNKEAPKSLFIVPWKSSEMGIESDLSSNLLNEKLRAVDKDVFERELDFYNLTATE
jgi:hypothetical protein